MSFNITKLLERARDALWPFIGQANGMDHPPTPDEERTAESVRNDIIKMLDVIDAVSTQDNIDVAMLKRMDIKAAIRDYVERILPSDPEADAMADKVFAKAIRMRGGRPIPRKPALDGEPDGDGEFVHDKYELWVHWTEHGGVGVHINGKLVMHAGYADPIGTPVRRCMFTHVRRRDAIAARGAK